MKNLINKICEIKIVKKVLENQGLMQFIKFGIVGFTNTLLSWVIYALVLLVLKPFNWHYDYICGNLLAFVISVAWSFFWNNRFVFKEKEGTKRVWWKALLKTYLTYAFTGLILDNVLAVILVDYCGVPKLLSPIICLLVTVPLNFIINKFWAFKDKKNTDNSEEVSEDGSVM